LSASNFFQYLRYAYAAYFSKPASDRLLVRMVRKHRPRSIVELGVRSSERSVRLIRMATTYADGDIRYTGVDLFEQRPPEQPALTLKGTHRLLKQTGAKVQLAPGDPFMALARYANMLSNTDLVVISKDQDEEALNRAWFYLPRMLHEKSLVFQEETKGDKTRFVQIPTESIQRQASTRRAA